MSPALIRYYLGLIVQDGGQGICLSDGSFPGIPKEALRELKAAGLVRSKFEFDAEIESLRVTAKGCAALRGRE